MRGVSGDHRSTGEDSFYLCTTRLCKPADHRTLDMQKPSVHAMRVRELPSSLCAEALAI
ncbi:hypothetical protein BD311DRAFT_308079 [Dichomitus squalens]|uniref:Uncharacterized protein n=1 Tax=Dichomitus squalens TaxID=114155 RepID=A0A4Q9MPR3_9APHY|nr:hypothetical protein BD311DRAFT_308079 [Dichomitus squalens]